MVDKKSSGTKRTCVNRKTGEVVIHYGSRCPNGYMTLKGDLKNPDVYSKEDKKKEKSSKSRRHSYESSDDSSSSSDSEEESSDDSEESSSSDSESEYAKKVMKRRHGRSMNHSSKNIKKKHMKELELFSSHKMSGVNKHSPSKMTSSKLSRDIRNILSKSG